ncbi:tetratricopeptide repeat (TPR)-like superfamily protein [Carex rostrata]
MSVYASTPSSHLTPVLPTSKRTQPSIPTDDTIKKRLLRKGVNPTPKILHNLRKKETLKSLRRAKKQALSQNPPPLTDAQKQALAEDEHFRTIRAEYCDFRRDLIRRRPWEKDKNVVDLNNVLGSGEEVGLRGDHLEELREMFKERNRVKFQWLLDDDLEEDVSGGEKSYRDSIKLKKRAMGDEQKIKLIVKSLAGSDMDLHDWRFVRLMKQSEIMFHEMNLLKVLAGLEHAKNWRQGLSVVKWVYSQKAYFQRKSRFVYTKLLSVLGKGRRPNEALQIFKEMLGEAQIYPDMAAYHSIAVTLGQAGMVHELNKLIENMRQKPSRNINSMRRKNWDPTLEPDVVIYNAVLNGCIPSSQWKGVFWVFDQMRYGCIEPNAASYGLAMEVMLNAGKYEFVHKFFQRMKKNGLATRAITYRILVKCLWKEGKADEAVEAVRDMERRGVVGESCVYYELACCLCNNGRWHDAMLEVEKLKKLRRTKPLEVTFTGMIVSSFEGGYINDCISIFEQMKHYCSPNTGSINSLLRVYARSDMFAKAKDLFERMSAVFHTKADEYTYSLMLEASASALQWEYFEFVYREMTLAGYQLDQRKHTSLIVEASKFGKSSLLEHAFDTILEAGDIPDVTIFTEMICHAISESDYQKTLNLINGMAYTSLKVNESQWIDLFRENMDRFRENALADLLNHVKSGHVVSEEPATSFVRSLEHLSGTNLLEATKSKVIVEEPEQKCLRVGKWKSVDQVLESLTADGGNIFDELPSAEEILKMWEQERTETCL